MEEISMRPVITIALGLYAGALLSGCGAFTFVSDKEKQDKIESLDDDGDGVTAFDGDCDDNDPRRSPNLEEIPYDGIDNDCNQRPDNCDGPDAPIECTRAVESDLLDVDNDGYMAITEAEYLERYRAANPDLDPAETRPWPDGTPTEVDCVETAEDVTLPVGITPRDINPAVAEDVPYDGVDADCGRDNDFDDDGDGQMPPTAVDPITGDTIDTEAAFSAYVLNWGLTGLDDSDPNSYGDCNDNRASSFAGNPVDEAYNGHDDDCSGDNDFDRDGDGYMWTGTVQADFNLFVQTYYPGGPATGPLEWGPDGNSPAASGDCLDQAHPNLPGAAPNEVYPSAPDAWYDGIDANCNGDNDFDSDLDGYIPNANIIDFADYVNNWSGGTGLPATVDPALESASGDCDDTNPTVAPGNLELLGDADDADCDLVADSTPWSFGGLAWDTPTWPRLVQTDHHYIVGMTAAWTSLGNRNDPALALLFEPGSATYDAEQDIELVWANNSATMTQVHGSGIDLVANADKFWIASTYYAPSPTGPVNDRARILIREQTYEAASNSYSYVLANRVFPWTGFDVDLDLQLDDQDKLWAIGCGGGDRDDPNGDNTAPGSFRAMTIVTPIDANVSLQDVPLFEANDTDPGGNDSKVCFQEIAADGLTAQLTICDDAGCVSWDADANTGDYTPAAASPWDGRVINESDYHGDLLLLAENNGGTIVDGPDQYSVFPGENVLSLDAMWRHDVLFVVGVLEDTPSNRVTLMYGTDPNSLANSVELPVYDNDPKYTHEPQAGCDVSVPGCAFGRNLSPYKISLLADDDRLALAVAARSIDPEPLGPLSTPPPGQDPEVLPQDAIGWLFMGFDGTALPTP